MRRVLTLAAILAGCGGGQQSSTGATAPTATAEATAPAPASDAKKAPDFTLNDTDGNPVALHDMLKKGPVILAFFPKAFTGG